MQTIMSAALQTVLHVPTGYTAGESDPLPLVVFLHGSGERGDDPERVKLFGPPRHLDKQPDFPFVVASPQCPADVRWTDIVDETLAVIEAVAASQRVDRDRVYLTGFSMGGQGAWNLAVRHADLFAAVAPVASRTPPGDDFLERLCALTHLPVWAAHSDGDSVVSVDFSDTMVETLRRCGADIRYTRYNGLEHGPTADAFYEGAALYEWFLSHRR